MINYCEGVATKLYGESRGARFYFILAVSLSLAVSRVSSLLVERAKNGLKNSIRVLPSPFVLRRFYKRSFINTNRVTRRSRFMSDNDS